MSKLFVQTDSKAEGIPADEFNVFSAWIKSQLSPVVAQVKACSKPIQGPAYLTSPVSSSMRSLHRMKSLIDKMPAPNEEITNLTMEVNLKNETMKRLN
jgi:hypothetical protein